MCFLCSCFYTLKSKYVVSEKNVQTFCHQAKLISPRSLQKVCYFVSGENVRDYVTSRVIKVIKIILQHGSGHQYLIL